MHPRLAGWDLAGVAEDAVDGDVVHARRRPRGHHPGVLPRHHGTLGWSHYECANRQLSVLSWVRGARAYWERVISPRFLRSTSRGMICPSQSPSLSDVVVLMSWSIVAP